MSSQPATETPEQSRAAFNAAIKRAMLAAESQCDVGWRGLFAHRCGISRQRVDQYLALDHDANISAALVAFLPRPIQAAVVAVQIGDGQAVCELPEAVESADDWHLVARAVAETAEPVRAYAEAIADGTVTAKEGAPIIEKCNAAISVLLGVRARGAAAVRERSVKVTKLRGVSR